MDIYTILYKNLSMAQEDCNFLKLYNNLRSPFNVLGFMKINGQLFLISSRRWFLRFLYLMYISNLLNIWINTQDNFTIYDTFQIEHVSFLFYYYFSKINWNMFHNINTKILKKTYLQINFFYYFYIISLHINVFFLFANFRNRL